MDTKKNDGQKLNSMMDISPKMTEPYMLGKPTNKKNQMPKHLNAKPSIFSNY